MHGIGLFCGGLLGSLPYQHLFAGQAGAFNGGLPGGLDQLNLFGRGCDGFGNGFVGIGVRQRHGHPAASGCLGLRTGCLRFVARFFGGQGGIDGLIAHALERGTQHGVVLSGPQQVGARCLFNVAHSLGHARKVQAGDGGGHYADLLANNGEGLAKKHQCGLCRFGTDFQRVQHASLANARGHVGECVFEVGNLLAECLRRWGRAVQLVQAFCQGREDVFGGNLARLHQFDQVNRGDTQAGGCGLQCAGQCLAQLPAQLFHADHAFAGDLAQGQQGVLGVCAGLTGLGHRYRDGLEHVGGHLAFNRRAFC